jgi:hypothetical protein
MSDFPAAHSMDTTWFAIDADGYVGIFDSSQGGAVPQDRTEVDWNSIDDTSELVDILCQDKYGEIQNINSIDIAAFMKDASLICLKRRIRQSEKLELSVSTFDWQVMEDLVLELSNYQTIAELKEQAKIILCFVDRRIIVYVDKCDRNWLKRSIASQTVLSGKEANLEHNLSWLGWYEYNCGNDSPTSYERNYRLKQPLHFNDLLPEVRDRLSIVKLPNIRFSETISIQPIEHLPCRTWGDSEYWIDTNGVEHDRFPEYPIDRTGSD